MSEDVLNNLILGCVIIGVAWAIAFMVKWSEPVCNCNYNQSEHDTDTTAKAPPLPTKPNMAE